MLPGDPGAVLEGGLGLVLGCSCAVLGSFILAAETKARPREETRLALSARERTGKRVYLRLHESAGGKLGRPGGGSVGTHASVVPSGSVSELTSGRTDRQASELADDRKVWRTGGYKTRQI